MFEELISIPIRIPRASPSLIPNGSGIMVVGSVALVGVLTLTRDRLVLDYQIHILGVDWMLPAQRVGFQFDAVSAMAVTGGWWRPMLEIHVRQPSAIAPLTVERDGCIRFRIARSHRQLARILIAEVALHAAQLLSDGRDVRD